MLGNSTELALNHHDNLYNNLYSTKLVSIDSNSQSSSNIRPKYKKTLRRTISKRRSILTSHSDHLVSPRRIRRASRKTNNKKALIKSKEEEDGDSEELDTDLPSPIPFLPPINKPSDSVEYQFPPRSETKKKSSVTDSDYKTQSSTMTSTPSSENEAPGNNDFHMLACERLLNLEERFIEQMQKGVQQYSRPLRHCLMINQTQHQTLFQNIEKILAISEYQLNQLINHDDSALFDMFNTIGKLYENKMRMSCEAFDIYLNGVEVAFELLNELTKHPTNHFTKFLNDAQDDIDMNLKEFLLLPLTYVANVHSYLNEIKKNTSNENKLDLISLTSLINRLDSYVRKSNRILYKYNISLNNMDSNESCLWSGEMRYKHSSLSGTGWRLCLVQVYHDRISIDISSQNHDKVLLINFNQVKKIDFNLENKKEFYFAYAGKTKDRHLLNTLRLKTQRIEDKSKIKSLFKNQN